MNGETYRSVIQITARSTKMCLGTPSPWVGFAKRSAGKAAGPAKREA